MRKDLKYLSAAGGLLVACVVVYLVLTPPSRRPVAADTGTAITPAPVITPTTPVVAPAARDPFAAPAITDRGPVEAPPVTPANPGNLISTPDSPRTPANFNWNTALEDPRPADFADRGSASPPTRIDAPNTPNTPVGTPLGDPGRGMIRTPVAPVDPRLAGDRTPGGTTPTLPNTPATPPPATRPNEVPKTYKIVAGDTFEKVAAKFYGDAKLWPHIERANPGVSSRTLKIGQTINLPDAALFARNPSDAPRQPDARRPVTPAAPAGPVAIDPTREYRVAAGDTLHRIAATLYGDANRWEKIYELNKTAIGNDPARLKIGMVLKLPEAPKRQTTAGLPADR